MNRSELIQLISAVLEDDETDSDSFLSSSSSEGEDDPVLEACGVVTSGNSIPKVEGYYENIIPLFSDGVFKSHFRMEPSTFSCIEEKVAQSIANTFGCGRDTVLPRKQLMMAIWLLATPESYRSIADRFGVSRSTLWESCFKVWRVFSSWSRSVIKWPSLPEMEVNAANFQQTASFPGVVGCVDGCHIPIKAPTESAECYVNRKGFHSVILQGVADNQCIFMDCYAGEVGAVHDARVFRKSALGQTLDEKIPANMHLLGDSAYPLKMNLLTPFRDNGHLASTQREYNTRLSKTRNVIERAFGLLKGRFRRLHHLDMSRIDLVPMVIVACCVLHNICQFKNDALDDFEPDVNEESYSTGGSNEDEPSGEDKRHIIAAMF